VLLLSVVARRQAPPRGYYIDDVGRILDDQPYVFGPLAAQGGVLVLGALGASPAYCSLVMGAAR